MCGIRPRCCHRGAAETAAGSRHREPAVRDTARFSLLDDGACRRAVDGVDGIDEALGPPDSDSVERHRRLAAGCRGHLAPLLGPTSARDRSVRQGYRAAARKSGPCAGGGGAGTESELARATPPGSRKDCRTRDHPDLPGSIRCTDGPGLPAEESRETLGRRCCPGLEKDLG